jgi:hypothetical protein
LERYWGNGKTDSEISEYTGHTIAACARKAYELGLSKTERRLERNSGVKTCKRNHPLTPDNIIKRRSGGNICRTCRNTWARSYHSRKMRNKREQELVGVN